MRMKRIDRETRLGHVLTTAAWAAMAAGACAAASAQGPAEPDAEARRAIRRTAEAELFEACRESVVTFTATRVERRPKAKGGSVTHTERGSGFVIHADGYVLTVSHALAKGGRPEIRLHDGKKHRARVIARHDGLDIALLKIDAGRPLKPLKLGHSRDLMVGERAFVLGNPFGFGLSLGAGLVTGLNRSTKTDFTHLTGMIQTDAGINPGMSGGPVVNLFGEAIGVAVSRKDGADGIGLATAIDRVRAALPDMIDAEGRSGFVLGMKVDANDTAVVREVLSGSPAAAAGVRAGDVVVGIGDVRIAGGVDFHLSLVGRKGGTKLPLKLRRGGEVVAATVTLGEVRPLAPAKVADLAAGLAYKAYRGRWRRLPDFRRLKPAASGTMPAFGLGEHKGRDNFAVELTGYIQVPADGVYAFYLLSDDGSRLYIGERLVVDHDGLHGPVEKRGFVSLKAGRHRIRVACFNAGGDEALKVSYEGPGIRKREVPARALFHKKPSAPSTKPSSRPTRGGHFSGRPKIAKANDQCSTGPS